MLGRSRERRAPRLVEQVADIWVLTETTTTFGQTSPSCRYRPICAQPSGRVAPGGQLAAGGNAPGRFSIFKISLRS